MGSKRSRFGGVLDGKNFRNHIQSQSSKRMLRRNEDFARFYPRYIEKLRLTVGRSDQMSGVVADLGR